MWISFAQRGCATSPSKNATNSLLVSSGRHAMHLARLHIQCCIQGQGAVAVILEVMPLGSPRTQRLKVEADDVGGFLLELRIVGGHVAVQLMRLQTRLRPHPLHGGFTDTQCCCHLAAGPMRGPIDWLALRFPCDAGLQSSI